MWTILNEGWVVRSLQEGLELLAPERNIVLELSDPDSRDVLSEILLGKIEFVEESGEEAIKMIIDDLITRGLLRRLDRCPIIEIEDKVTKTLWEIRKNVVGKRGPIQEVYWLDANESRFSPNPSQLFIAKYLEINNGKKKKVLSWAFGTHEQDRETAELKAIMEALERHSSGVIPVKELIKCTSKNLPGKAIDLHQIIAYTKRQYKINPSLFPFAKDRDYNWKEVMTYPEGEKRYLPIECIYYPVDKALSPSPYTFFNSSGVAAGFSFDETLLRGLYETIERDAFMLTWINHIVMPRIEKKSLPREMQLRIQRIEALGHQVHLINCTMDLAPVVIVVVVSLENEPSLLMGAASNLNIIKACSKAMAEIEQQLFWYLRKSTESRPLYDPNDVKTIPDHSALYWTPRYLSQASFLWAGESKPVNTIELRSEHELDMIVDLLKAHGNEVVVADLTPPFLKEIGIKVIRAIPLGLIPITFGYGNEPMGMRRIKESFVKNRWSNNRPFVHPFS